MDTDTIENIKHRIKSASTFVSSITNLLSLLPSLKGKGKAYEATMASANLYVPPPTASIFIRMTDFHTTW
jgi:hypothetical protein